MSDKEFLESEEEEGTCPNYFWYLIGSFGLTALIILILIAYLIMYSNHFMWALRRNPRPSIKKKSKSKGSSAGKDAIDSTESAMKGTSQIDDASQQTSQQKDAQPDVTT
ncbi:tRNA-dihydrouridine(16/17) synthase [NAD(P)(+)]-like [Dirofilaria immitis]